MPAIPDLTDTGSTVSEPVGARPVHATAGLPKPLPAEDRDFCRLVPCAILHIKLAGGLVRPAFASARPD